MKHARAVGPLLHALKDEDWHVRELAAWALGEIGEPAAQPLKRVLKDEAGDVREKAAWALGRISGVKDGRLEEQMPRDLF